MVIRVKENRVSRTYKGGANIDRFFGKENPADSFFPEDWTASVTSAYNSTDGKTEGLGVIEDGKLIKDLVNGDNFSILVKLLDSAERLVIQAHPTVAFAKRFITTIRKKCFQCCTACRLKRATLYLLTAAFRMP